MKIIIATIGFVFAYMQASPQRSKDTAAVKYDVVVLFNSICCGPAKDDFLKHFLSLFNKKNKSAIGGYRIGGCGREGEFKILFSLPLLKRAKKKKFLAALNSLVSNQNKANRAANKSTGSIELYPVAGEEPGNCRGELIKWE